MFGADRIVRIAVAAALSVATHFTGIVYLFPVAYAIVGYDIVFAALKGIISKNPFNENALMVIATAGAFAIGAYEEAVAVMLFYQIGELFQERAIDKSRRSVEALAQIVPDFANLETDDGTERVDPDDVPVGSVIVVKPGERIPIDGIVKEGWANVDVSSVTGEHVPVHAGPGTAVKSGCMCLDGLIRIETTATYGDSTATRIMDLVLDAYESKSKSERFVTRFAAKYTPAVLVLALLLFTIPTFVLGGAAEVWGYRALLFLVISCPCALVVSVPLAFFGGIGNASSKGILVKGGLHLESLATVDTVVFDKTGTLTHGKFTVSEICPHNGHSDSILEMAAHAEEGSNHPISKSIKDAYGNGVDGQALGDFREIPGRGVVAEVNGVEVLVGNEEHMESSGIEYEGHDGGTVIHVAYGDEYAGHMHISDTVRDSSREAVSMLKSMKGIKKTVMLTGDSSSSAEAAFNSLGLHEYHAGLLPGDKLRIVNELKLDGKVLFVGDGINDAPAIAGADVGMAMGGIGSDAAIEAADVVLTDDNPMKIPEAIKISRKTVGIAKQNVVFAVGTKLLFLAVGAIGLISMWEAVFADVGVAVIAVLNSARALK